METERTSHPEVESHPVTDRERLRAGLETTRSMFHAVLDSVSSDRWLRKSPGCAWTVREVVVHMTWALEHLPEEVARARRGRGMFNMPKWLADPMSYLLIRWLARNSTPESVRRRYDAATAAAIAALETVPDSDWLLGAVFYGEGFHTVADLFQGPRRHLAQHTAGL